MHVPAAVAYPLHLVPDLGSDVPILRVLRRQHRILL
jgi:hypothetical protein